jgi:hypothetical protein
MRARGPYSRHRKSVSNDYAFAPPTSVRFPQPGPAVVHDLPSAVIRFPPAQPVGRHNSVSANKAVNALDTASVSVPFALSSR